MDWSELVLIALVPAVLLWNLAALRTQAKLAERQAAYYRDTTDKMFDLVSELTAANVAMKDPQAAGAQITRSSVVTAPEPGLRMMAPDLPEDLL